MGGQLINAGLQSLQTIRKRWETAEAQYPNFGVASVWGTHGLYFCTNDAEAIAQLENLIPETLAALKEAGIPQSLPMPKLVMRSTFGDGPRPENISPPLQISRWAAFVFDLLDTIRLKEKDKMAPESANQNVPTNLPTAVGERLFKIGNKYGELAAFTGGNFFRNSLHVILLLLTQAAHGRKSTQAKIWLLHVIHPDWNNSQLALAAGCHRTYLSQDDCRDLRQKIEENREYRRRNNLDELQRRGVIKRPKTDRRRKGKSKSE
jgi:hypothetical protein